MHAHTLTHADTYTQTHTQTHTDTDTDTYTHRHTDTDTDRQTHTETQTHTDFADKNYLKKPGADGLRPMCTWFKSNFSKDDPHGYNYGGTW